MTESSLEKNCWHHKMLKGGCQSFIEANETGYKCERCGKLWSLSGFAVKPPKNVELPHSRACGITPHAHGPYCSRDCPTCSGEPVMTQNNG